MSVPPPSTLEIARALVAFPSVTPADAGALPYLKRLLDDAGFQTHLVRFSEPGTPEIDNLYARFGTAAPNFAFAGHTDVVPPGDVSLLALRSLRGRGRGWQALGPRRGGHEGRRRRRGRRRAALRRAARRSRARSLSAHRRRGRPGDQRHGETRSNGRGRGASVSTIACSASRPASTRSATRSRTAAAVR